MRVMSVVVSVMAVIFFLNEPLAEARQGILPGRAAGVVSVGVSKTTPEKIVAALKKVFIGDGFKLAKENSERVVFERPARRGKDLAYGGVIANEGGMWERVVVIITDNGGGSFTLECNPSMVSDKGQGVFENDEEVLKMFAGEYRRLMRRVQLEI